MLRWLVAMVLLLNLGFFAWSQHWFAPIGLAPVLPTEPERLQQQIRPEIITIKKDIPANLPAQPVAAASDSDEAVVDAAAAAPDMAASR